MSQMALDPTNSLLWRPWITFSRPTAQLRVPLPQYSKTVGFLSPEYLQQSPPAFQSCAFSESCVQPVMSPGEISGRYFLGSPGKGWDGAWLKCPMRKIPMVPSINSSAMTMKHILSITLATRNHSSFSCRARKRMSGMQTSTSFSGTVKLNPNTNKLMFIL